MAHESIRKYLLKNKMDADKIMAEADDENKVEGPNEAKLESEIDGKRDRWEDNKGRKGKRGSDGKFC